MYCAVILAFLFLKYRSMHPSLFTFRTFCNLLPPSSLTPEHNPAADEHGKS